MRRSLWLAAVALAACAEDPVYLAPTPAAVEVGSPDGPTTGTASITIPIRNPTEEDNDERAAIATELGVGWDQVPSVRRDEIALEVEWTLKNLTDGEATAVISVVGANEWFAYDPEAFILDPEEDEAPPPLMGGIPIVVPPLGSVNGVFREDELSEAAQDLDALTRWGFTPERAILDEWDSGDIVDDAGVMLASHRMIPALLRLDVSVASNSHMVMEYVVRVRDETERLAPYEDEWWTLMTPAANGSYVPPPPP